MTVVLAKMIGSAPAEDDKSLAGAVSPGLVSVLQPVVKLPEAARGGFGLRPLLATHNLHRHPLFNDAALAELLDRYPRQHLYALTMGADDTRTEENFRAVHDGVCGADLLRAVRNGRLWLNITQLHVADARYAAVIDALFAQLRVFMPGFQVESTQGTLLISSPRVLVYYHADERPSLLWHIRGRKRVWVYPANDERFMSREHLEDIYAGVRHEYLPFNPSYDDGATVYDLEPGQWLSWPHNAPHRVTNLDSVSVSLSTEFVTAQWRARSRLYLANRFLRTRLGLRNLSNREDGPTALVKSLVHRVARKAGFDPLQLKRYVATLRVDPDTPGGVVPLADAAFPAVAAAIEVRCFESFAALEPLREQIDALNLASPRPDPFSTFEFFQNYWAHDELSRADAGLSLVFLCAFREGALAGYLPLKQTCQRVFGLPAVKLDFFAQADVDLPHLVAMDSMERTVAAAFTKWLCGHRPRWSLLEFHRQTASSPLAPASLECVGGRYRKMQWPTWNTWTIPVHWNSLAEYIADVPKKLRSNVRRLMRRMLASGRLEFLASDDPAATPGMLQLYCAIESNSWKARAGASVGRSPERIRYFEGLLSPHQPMRISILLLLLDGVPIAGMINGAFAGDLYALQIVFDDRVGQLSPGTAMLLMTVRQAIAGGYRNLNLLAGYDYYKRHWLAEPTATQSTQIYRRGSPLFWRRMLGDLVRQCLPRTRPQMPVLFNTTREHAGTPPPQESRTANSKLAAEFAFHARAEEQRRCAELIERARRGRCEWLDQANLESIVPFDEPALPRQLNNAGLSVGAR